MGSLLARRRVVGLALLILAPGFMVESAVGLARDGAIHHETVGAAIAHHAAGPQGHHGHEDAGPSPRYPPHGQQHQHGTATDHCTHAHGVGLISAFAFRVEAPVSKAAEEDLATHLDQTPLTDIPPPRA